VTTREPSPLLFDDRGGEDEGGERDEYASESEGIVRPEAERSCGGEGGVSLDIVVGSVKSRWWIRYQEGGLRSLRATKRIAVEVKSTGPI
jgi:hypothetical protein